MPLVLDGLFFSLPVNRVKEAFQGKLCIFSAVSVSTVSKWNIKTEWERRHLIGIQLAQVLSPTSCKTTMYTRLKIRHPKFPSPPVVPPPCLITGAWWILICLCVRERRPTWAEERRMNSETFGIPLRHNRGRGGFRGRGFMPPRGGRGRLMSRGSFGPPRGAPPGFRGGFRGGRGGRDFSDFEYRVNN